MVQSCTLPMQSIADMHGFCVHALRATAATNALAHNADIAKVQEWLGHANIATTRLYDRRQSRPEESPTGRVPAGCGYCFGPSPNPSERGQSVGDQHSKPVL